MTQMQARTIAEEAKAASECALLQAARLKEEQQKTTAQVSQGNRGTSTGGAKEGGRSNAGCITSAANGPSYCIFN